jgi:hypothetical protein
MKHLTSNSFAKMITEAINRVGEERQVLPSSTQIFLRELHTMLIADSLDTPENAAQDRTLTESDAHYYVTKETIEAMGHGLSLLHRDVTEKQYEGDRLPMLDHVGIEETILDEAFHHFLGDAVPGVLAEEIRTQIWQTMVNESCRRAGQAEAHVVGEHTEGIIVDSEDRAQGLTFILYAEMRIKRLGKWLKNSQTIHLLEWVNKYMPDHVQMYNVEYPYDEKVEGDEYNEINLVISTFDLLDMMADMNPHQIKNILTAMFSQLRTWETG